MWGFEDNNIQYIPNKNQMLIEGPIPEAVILWKKSKWKQRHEESKPFSLRELAWPITKILITD